MTSEDTSEVIFELNDLNYPCSHAFLACKGFPEMIHTTTANYDLLTCLALLATKNMISLLRALEQKARSSTASSRIPRRSIQFNSTAKTEEDREQRSLKEEELAAEWRARCAKLERSNRQACIHLIWFIRDTVKSAL